jgi:hypothetical protein
VSAYGPPPEPDEGGASYSQLPLLQSELFFYSQSEYNKWLDKSDIKQWDIKYKKGLAALVDDDYESIISNPRLVLIKKDDMSSDCLETWFGKNSDLRKTELLK